ncbi:MAG TPA: IclR family transcriptional regulator [Jiangellaceae bacterium]
MPGPIQAIERAAAVLQLLARGSNGLALGDIAASLDLPKGTAHGILRTLRTVGFVQQDRASGMYRLGTALLQLGASHLDANELRSSAINWADSLAARSREAVRIGMHVDGNVLVVHHVFRPDDTPQMLDVGALVPLHATALGKVLLAYDATVAAPLQRRSLSSFTRRTIVRPAELARALGEVRSHGWAYEAEEYLPGEAGIAAPIRARGGMVLGAIGISGAVDRVCDSALRPKPNLVTLVRDAARAVSRELDDAG